MDMKQLLQGIPSCECGMNHQCAIREVVIGHDALNRIPELLCEHRNVVLVCDKNTYRVAGEKVLDLLNKADFTVSLCLFDQEEVVIPNEEAIAKIDPFVTADTRAIVGVGSGVINDLCKYVSGSHNLPYMIAATAPSMDGYASVGAAMILGGMKVTVNHRVPAWIVGDTAVLKDAPLDMIRAGIGDILGKYSCLNDWKLSHLITGELFCQPVYDLVMGEVLHCREDVDQTMARGEEAIGRLMTSLVVVGIGMAYMGNSRPASGSEHHLSHFYEIVGIVRGQEYLPHGIDVAFATLITCQLRRMLLNADPATFAANFDATEWEKAVRKVYGPLADSVIALQEKVGFRKTDRLPTILSRWEEIKAALAEVPSREEMEELLGRAGYRFEEFVSLYGEEKIRESMIYAKDLKDRYTLSWLLEDVGLNKKLCEEAVL